MKNLSSNKKIITEYITIFVGVLIASIGITVFFSPNNMVTGGVTGLGIIIQKASYNVLEFEIPLWLTNIVFNVPLFFIGFKVLGFSFIKRTLFATFSFSLALFITSFLPVFKVDDLLLVVVFGGVIEGVGLGLVIKSFATTGGSDLLASIIHRFKKHLSISKIMFGIDFTIIFLGFFFFGARSSLYAIMAAFIITKVIGMVLEGLSFSKVVFIISDHAQSVSKEIFGAMSRGVTGLNATGMFTKNEKNVLMCVVSNREITQLKEIVKFADSSAFVIVADVREVLGEGFNSI